MSSPTSSTHSPTTSPTRRPRGLSRFVEGTALTGPDLLTRTPTSNEHFMSVLAMEDALSQRKHQHRGSNSSVESFASSQERPKSGGFGRRSMDERPKIMQNMEIDAEKVVQKFKGRLRAFTGSSVKDVKPYPGT